MIRLIGAVLLALAISSAAYASDRPRLLIQRIGPAVSTLYVANANGSDERSVFAAPALDYNAAMSPDGQWILFTSERTGSADIYRARIDGSALERLTDDPAYDDQAAWSPDGNRIVFVSTRRSGAAHIWTLDLRTRRARAITEGSGGDFRPSWSPDGRWIAFSSDRGTGVERDPPEWEQLQRASLYLIRPDGTGLRRLTDGARFAGSPRWSPDAKRVVFYEMSVSDTHAAREDDRQAQVVSQIVSVVIETGARLEHTSGGGLKVSPQFLDDARVGYLVKAGTSPGLAYAAGGGGPAGDMRNPTWSADGRRVVYDRGRATEGRRGYAPLQDMSRAASPYDLAHFGRLAAYSPDGRRLAFSEPLGGGTWAIGVMNADGSAPRRLFSETGSAALAPRWSPDGQQLVFGLGGGFSTRNMPARIMMMQADGSNLRELAKGAGAGFPSLSPDGKRLVFRVWGQGADERGLRILTLASGTVTHLTDSGYDTFPGWSPRGDLIAFTSLRGGDFDIYTVRPDGAGLKQLTTARGNDAHSSWSPNGAHLMFSSSRHGFKDEAPLADDQAQPYGEVFVMRADGTRQVPLTDNQWEDGPGTWPPPQAPR